MSYPNSFLHISAFSSELVNPIILHPYILAIWPTAEPTLPAAVVTTIVSFVLGLHMSTRPAKAVIPLRPNAPRLADKGT